MAFEIEWLTGAQNELDAEIAFVLNEFGFKAAQKAYLRIQDHINCLTTFSDWNIISRIDLQRI